MQADQHDVIDALWACDPNCDRDLWVKVGMAFHAAGGAFEDFDRWSAGGSTYSARSAAAVWRSFGVGDIKPATLFKFAREQGWRRGSARVERPAPPPRPAPAEPPRRTTLSDYGLELWEQCLPISSVALQYLKARRCVTPPKDGDLRWHPALKHPSGYVGPALVGLISHVHTRKPMSLHRTWITSTGKADVSPPRLPLAGHSTKDGVIRLWPDEAVTHGIGVAEGIESALSLAWAHAPVWACIDAGHLRQFPLLECVECLVIARDRDPAGERATHECAQRWADAGRSVAVTAQVANDLNDVALEVHQ